MTREIDYVLNEMDEDTFAVDEMVDDVLTVPGYQFGCDNYPCLLWIYFGVNNLAGF